MSILFAGLLLSSCQLLEENDPKDQVIATQGNQDLKWGAAREYISGFKSSQDSVLKVQKYVKEWQLKQKILTLAQQDSLLDLEAINHKVERLKEDLIIHRYYSNYIANHLDTTLSEQEMSDYYYQNPSNFVLKDKVVKGFVIKIASNNPMTREVKKLFNSSDQASYSNLIEIATKEATNYTFSTDQWMKLSDMLIETPLYQNTSQKKELLSQKKIILAQNQNTYLLKITEQRNEGDIAPLQFKKQTIKRIILNERKKNLISNLQEKISLTPNN